MRTTRQPDFQSSAEIENEQKNMMHATLRFRARIVGDAGAVAGLFTYADDSDETDVEVLTRLNSSTIYYSTQPSVDKHGNDIPEGSVAVGGLPDYNDWHEHRIDWLPGVTRWFVDGALARTSTYGPPRKPSGLVMNMWSNGGVWSGNMSVGAAAELHVQWIEVAFNTSGPRAGIGSHRGSQASSKVRRDLGKRKQAGCKVVCAIDAVATPGFPEIKYTAGALSEGMRQSSVVLLLGALSMSLMYSWV
jgi:beta-glucanase (GH16 family)